MEEYIKLFKNHTLYETYKNSADYVTPNISYCKLQDEVHYNPWVDNRLVATFNVTNISSATSICFNETLFSEIEIDGIVQPSVISSYTFSTTGEHIIKYTLLDPTSIAANAFRNCSNLISVTIPNSVTSIDTAVFNSCTNLSNITSLATIAPTIQSGTFRNIKSNGTLIVPSGSSGYNVWMGTGNYYLGSFNWTKVEQ